MIQVRYTLDNCYAILHSYEVVTCDNNYVGSNVNYIV